VNGWYYVSVVLIYCLLVNTLYILGHVLDHRCDTPIESFIIHSSNIGHRSRVQYEGRASSVLNFPLVIPLMCRYEHDLSNDY
jgi:hypothetical protein